MIVDRLHYLSIGGHNPEFSGHGYEDFELYHRLMVEDNKIPRSSNYLNDTKSWGAFTYNGFRSQLTVCARPALMMGLIVFHMWHPRPKSSSFYNLTKMKENRERIAKAFEQFDKDKKHPKPLVSLNDGEVTKNILFFSKFNENSYNCMRNIYPLLGEVICTNEFNFFDVVSKQLKHNFKEFLLINNIDLILFPNPYGNEARLKIYNWCRSNNFPYLCFERGALPDSWFLDSKGCNADSNSYKTINYQLPLQISEQDNIEKYIQHCLYDANPLEIQGSRIGREALLNSLGITGEKVLFVPLQRPSDSVIKHFIGGVESYDNFIHVIDKLAGILKSYGWVTLVKNHPLETITPTFSNVTLVPEKTNFLDLIEACDAAALINSGVGVYCMMAEKPCYIFGDAFYQVPDVNFSVSSEQYASYSDLNIFAGEIAKGKNINKENMFKFIHFLRHNLYSFGRVKTTLRKEKDSSLRTITTGISFYDVKINSKVLFDYKQDDTPQISLSAPLLERFGLDIHMKEKAKQVPQPIVKSNSKVITKKSVRLIDPSQNTMHEILDKKLRIVNKLKNKPYDFFNDSQIKNLKKLRVLFEK